MRIRSLFQTIFGILTFIPGVYEWRSKRLGSGGTYSASYCYSVWMRHIVSLNSKIRADQLKTIAELGPGDSIGVGLVALLLGVDRYYAFDVVEFSNIENNLKIFDEIVALVQKRSPIPDEDEFPRIQPHLDNYEFPSEIYSDEYLDSILSEERIKFIRKSILNPKANDSMIVYKAPWFHKKECILDELDLIYSQAVLEHIDNLSETYHYMYLSLKNGGLMSHSIDFKSHGYSETWDGHWKISNIRWSLLRGNRPYMLNRKPYSYHIDLMKKNGFKVIDEKILKRKPSIKKAYISKFCSNFTEDDRKISGAYIVATAIR